MCIWESNSISCSVQRSSSTQAWLVSCRNAEGLQGAKMACHLRSVLRHESRPLKFASKSSYKETFHSRCLSSHRKLLKNRSNIPALRAFLFRGLHESQWPNVHKTHKQRRICHNLSADGHCVALRSCASETPQPKRGYNSRHRSFSVWGFAP